MSKPYWRVTITDANGVPHKMPEGYCLSDPEKFEPLNRNDPFVKAMQAHIDTCKRVKGAK